MAPNKAAKRITWHEIQLTVPLADEKECLAMLNTEKKGAARPQFLLRIHGRYNMLRVQRERNELMALSGTK